LLEIGLNALASGHNVTIDELIESREALEVPAARLAALRRDDDHLERLKRSLQIRQHDASVDARYAFHQIILDASGNQLLAALARPVQVVLLGSFSRQRSMAELWDMVHDDHTEIDSAIRDGDAERAANGMKNHLEHLLATYQPSPKRTRVTRERSVTKSRPPRRNPGP
jgi:DNA-binding FadR family transcriptional regulator